MRNELRLMDVNSQQFARGSKEYRKVQKQIDTVNGKLKGMNATWKAIKQEIKNFGFLAIAALGAQELLAQVDNLIRGNAQLSDSMADVAKTTELYCTSC